MQKDHLVGGDGGGVQGPSNRFAEDSYRACLYGNATVQQQASAAAQIALLHGLKGELLLALEEGRRAIGDHSAPDDCYATGPMTGNGYRDLVECPACSFIAMLDNVTAKATGAA